MSANELNLPIEEIDGKDLMNVLNAKRNQFPELIHFPLGMGDETTHPGRMSIVSLRLHNLAPSESIKMPATQTLIPSSRKNPAKQRISEDAR